MNYMTLREASKKWNVSVRRINLLCSEGKIPGAIKKQNLWMIPSEAQKPRDGRRKKAPLKEPSVLLRNTTYVETHCESDVCDYDKTICNSTEMWLKGQVNEAILSLKHFIETCTDQQYLIIAYYILGYYYHFVEDTKVLKSTEKKMVDLMKDPDISTLSKAMINLRTPSAPFPAPVFQKADDQTMKQLYPYLMLQSLRHFLTNELINNHNTNSLIPGLFYHMLSLEDYPESNLYCHILLSAYHSIIGSDDYALIHLKEAFSIARPRGWYTPFAQYAIILNLSVIDEIDHNAFQNILFLFNKYFHNFMNLGFLSNDFEHAKGKNTDDLQIAYQIACGKTTTEIADYFGISTYKVKKSISNLYAKTGFSSRAEIKNYILSHIMF